MALTTAQLAALKADIAASEFAGLPNNDDVAFAIAAAYNLDASPDFIVWRTSVSRQELFDATVLTDLIARSAGERDTYMLMLDQGAVNAAKAAVRQGFADIFSGPGGATTRAQLTADAKRKATRAEKLLASGTVSDAVPATLGFEGNLSYGDVRAARILNGVMVAVLVSLLLLIRRAAHPRVAFLGNIPGTRSYSDIERNPDNTAVPGALLFRVEASLLYFNIEHVRDAVWQKIRSAPGPLKLVVCDLSTSPYVDLAGARMLAKLNDDLKAAGIRLRLVAAHAAVRDMLRAEGLEEHVGYFGRRISVADVIDEFQGRTRPGAATGLTAPA